MAAGGTTRAGERLGRPGGSALQFRLHRAHPMYKRFHWDENIPLVRRGRKIERVQHMGYVQEYRDVMRELGVAYVDPERRGRLEARREQLEEWFNRRENPLPVANPGVVKRFFGGLFRKAHWIITWGEFLAAVKGEMVRKRVIKPGEVLDPDVVDALKDLYDGSVRAYKVGGQDAVDEFLAGAVLRKSNPFDWAQILGLGVVAGAVQGLVEPVVTRKVYGRRAVANPKSELYRKLAGLREEIARKAQKVYDEWEPDASGEDCEYGTGGICDAVAAEIAGVVAGAGVDTSEGGQDGDDHAWVVAYNDTEAYGVDIDPRVYETGGGYSWKKRKGVEIEPGDVEVFAVDRELAVGD